MSMRKELRFLDLLEEALRISCTNRNFIIVTLFSSLPLFSFLVFYETFFQSTLDETLGILALPPGYSHWRDWPIPFSIADRMTWGFAFKLLQLGLLYMLPLHVLEFFNSVVTVSLASKLKLGEPEVGLKEMASDLSHIPKLKGPFITSAYVLLLSSGSLLGLIWLLVHSYIILRRFGDVVEIVEAVWVIMNVLLSIPFGSGLVALLIKYSDWSAEWNTSIVVSILEDPYGAEAFAVSSYFSRANKKCGRLLMLVFLTWGVGLRVTCLHCGCSAGVSGILMQAMLLCVGHVLKWVSFVLYFRNCKKMIFGTRFVGEAGAVQSTKTVGLVHASETGDKVDPGAFSEA